MKVFAVALCVAALTATAWAGTPRSPLDQLGTLLGSKPDLMPNGLKPGRDCLPDTTNGCWYTGASVEYWISEGRIREFRFSKVRGRFQRSLPFGLTGSDDIAAAKAAFRARHIKAAPTADYPNILYAGPVRVNHQDLWFYLDFGRSGRLYRIRAMNFEDCDGE